MDGHGRSTTTSVAELRLRLYRPEPPAGAVAAYLAALRAEPVVGAGAPAPAARLHHRPRPVAAVAAGACLVGAIAASTLIGRQVPELVAPPAVRAPASTSSSTSPLPAPPLMGVPLGDLFGTGPATGRFSANGHRVVASVLCSGVATLAVRIGSEPPTLLSCAAGPAAFAVVASGRPQHGFTISVRPDAPIRWSLAAAAVG